MNRNTLSFLRIIAAVVGAVTALNVLLGFMKAPEFVVADVLAGAFLLISAVIPSRDYARLALIAANAYALGVFSIALAQRMAPGGVFNPGLVVIMIAAAASIAALIFKGTAGSRQ